ncbi:MAG: hypothetical protein R2827_12795 [Bdellovibrionales bacterium]
MGNSAYIYDDIKANPRGHFVILGISGDLQKVTLADPMEGNPLTNCTEYEVDTQHFINALLIGVITYDANMTTIKKEED